MRVWKAADGWFSGEPLTPTLSRWEGGAAARLDYLNSGIANLAAGEASRNTRARRPCHYGGPNIFKRSRCGGVEGLILQRNGT